MTDAHCASQICLPDALFAARPRRHVVLVGPSGAGKSTVAPRVAAHLGWAYLDLDDVITGAAGRPIHAIFASDQEAGFRRLEALAAAKVMRRVRPVVLAAGGGTWANLQARKHLQAHAQEVLLTVSPEQAWERLHSRPQQAIRPLLAGSGARAAMAQLARIRQEAYGLCGLTVCTDGRCPQQVADEVVACLHGQVPTTLMAAHKREHYSVHLADDGPEQLVRALAQQTGARKAAIISDSTVMALHADRYCRALAATGLEISRHTVAPGEASKSFAVAQKLISALSRAGFGRRDVVVGLGGGVPLDLAAFVAGIYLRGTPFIGVATTTLAAIDASVGGKNGINTQSGKNQVGLIRAPNAVVVDVQALLTQPACERLAGAVEAVKMGALFAPPLMELAGQAGLSSLQWRTVVAQAVALKIAVCGQDADDKHVRALLNYGHTVGHAIEAGSHYSISHGRAVGLGMIAEASYAEATGLAHGVVARLQNCLRAMNMPVDWRRATIDYHALWHDKKSDGNNLMLPVVSRLGSAALQPVSLAHFEAFLRTP